MENKSIFNVEQPEHSPGFLLWQTTVCWQRQIKKALELYEISHAQFVIMAILLWFSEKQVDVTQIVLVNMSKLDKMTVSKSLKKLAENNFINRVENKADTRSKNVSLTVQGRELISKLVPVVEAVDADFFSEISIQEQSFLLKLLNKLVK